MLNANKNLQIHKCKYKFTNTYTKIHFTNSVQTTLLCCNCNLFRMNFYHSGFFGDNFMLQNLNKWQYLFGGTHLLLFKTFVILQLCIILLRIKFSASHSLLPTILCCTIWNGRDTACKLKTGRNQINIFQPSTTFIRSAIR